MMPEKKQQKPLGWFFHSAARERQRKVRQSELPLPPRLICSYRKPTKVPKEGERREGGTTKRVWLQKGF